jgi:hypothetical protein
VLGSSRRRKGEVLPDLAFRVTQEQESRNRKVAMGKTRLHRAPANGDKHTPQISTERLAKPVRLQDPDLSSNNCSRTAAYLARASDLRVSADRIRYFTGLDLGELVSLPAEREDLFALSIRMEDNFTGLVDSALQLISKDHEEIAPETLEALCQDLALGFIERYGTLALCSSSVLRVLWSAQRLKSEKRPTFLRQVGRSLAIFVAAQKGRSPQRSVDIAFTLGKPQFLAELEQLSYELGASGSNDLKGDQLLRFVRTGKYEMLRQNLTWLEQFLRCDATKAADGLAQYGARGLTCERVQSVTPDWFFYTWVAWMVNKTPKTVRRLIQTAETKFRGQISSYEKTHKR